MAEFGGLYGGYVAKSQMNRQQEAQELAKMGAMQGILAKVQAQQEQEKIKGILSKTGGDPAKAVNELISIGTPQSLDMAAKIKSMIPDPSQAALRQAQTISAQVSVAEGLSKIQDRDRQTQGQTTLMGLLNPQSPAYTQGLSVAPTMFGTDQQALEALKKATAEGRPMNAVSPNQGALQAAAIQAYPKDMGNMFAKSIFPSPDNARAAFSATPGSVIYDRQGNPLSTVPGREPAPRNKQFQNTSRGIMEVTPRGLIPVLDDDGKPLMPHAGFSTQNNQALALSRAYESHPAVKQYNTIAPALTYAAQYMAAIPKNGATAADDAAMTKLYIAVTHPKGDQISNMDMRQLAQQPDLEDRVARAISGFLAGQKLPTATRNEFWNVISGKFKAMDSEKTKKRKEIESRANEMGLNPNAIFGAQ